MALKVQTVIFAPFPKLVIFLNKIQKDLKKIQTFLSFHNTYFLKIKVTSPCER